VPRHLNPKTPRLRRVPMAGSHDTKSRECRGNRTGRNRLPGHRGLSSALSPGSSFQHASDHGVSRCPARVFHASPYDPHTVHTVSCREKAVRLKRTQATPHKRTGWNSVMGSNHSARVRPGAHAAFSGGVDDRREHRMIGHAPHVREKAPGTAMFGDQETGFRILAEPRPNGAGPSGSRLRCRYLPDPMPDGY